MTDRKTASMFFEVISKYFKAHSVGHHYAKLAKDEFNGVQFEYDLYDRLTKAYSLVSSANRSSMTS